MTNPVLNDNPATMEGQDGNQLELDTPLEMESLCMRCFENVSPLLISL